VILIDANLLIYAVNLDAHHHQRARGWLEDTLSGATSVGLPWICLLAFLRVTTRPGILARPLRAEQALGFVASWLDQPFVAPVAPGRGHWPILRNLLRWTGTAGNLTSDAHVAALAIEYGAAVYSADHDFKRFPGVDHVNPLDDPGRARD
jgi:toxin-antitoxin system PIN domain toxin